MPVRILIVDDHAVVREGLQMFLGLDPELEIVGAAQNGAEALEMVRELQPDLVLMDLMMPVMDGVTATAAITREFPDMAVLALTSVPEDDSVTQAVVAGARGYLLKGTDSQQLRRAIKEAAAGRTQLSRYAVARLARELRAAQARPQPADSATLVRTFLIADIRGYTRFTQERGDEAAAQLAAKFAALAREIVGNHEGQVTELRGDEALAVFASTRQALRAAMGMQARFREETRVQPELPMHVGVGIDTGEAVAVEGGYRGRALNFAARLCSLAGPGEVLTTEVVTHVAGHIEGIVYIERGDVALKGIDEPVRVFQVTREREGPPRHSVS